MWAIWVLAAAAADLNGWDGIPWGSTKGGPKDPAKASDPSMAMQRASFGQVGMMQVKGSLFDPMTPGGMPKGTFAGVPVVGTEVVYIEGEAAQFVATLADISQTKTAMDAFVAAFGAPKETGPGGMWAYFEIGEVSVTLQMHVVTVRSLARRDRCAELFGASCALLRPGEVNALMEPAVVR